jgi:hypothetical protein
MVRDGGRAAAGMSSWEGIKSGQVGEGEIGLREQLKGG